MAVWKQTAIYLYQRFVILSSLKNSQIFCWISRVPNVGEQRYHCAIQAKIIASLSPAYLES